MGLALVFSFSLVAVSFVSRVFGACGQSHCCFAEVDETQRSLARGEHLVRRAIRVFAPKSCGFLLCTCEEAGDVSLLPVWMCGFPMRE